MQTKISLFTGITPDEYKRMMSCFHAVEKSFSADETICFFSDHPDRIGCLLEGEAAIIRTHLDGRQTILEYLKEGDVFGSALSALSPDCDSLQVVCIKNCKIQFIDYAHLIKRCPNACSFHSLLVSNALQLISRKAIALSEHLEILSQRTTREKLLCYFEKLAQEQHSDSFTLPFSLTTLADYLSVDRSAMMRELKKLKAEGIVKSDRKTFTLIHQNLLQTRLPVSASSKFQD